MKVIYGIKIVGVMTRLLWHLEHNGCRPVWESFTVKDPVLILAGFDTGANRDLDLYAHGAPRLKIGADRIFPLTDSTPTGGFQLGQSSHRFYWIWSSVGSIRTSDARLKTDIKEMPYGLDELMQLRPTSYHWKEDPEGPTSIGLIAQELQAVIPEAVTIGNDQDKMLGVTYSDLIPVLIKSVQEQQEQIDSLKKQLEDLEAAE